MAAPLSDFSAASVRKVSQTSFPQTFCRHAASSRFDISFSPSDFNPKRFQYKLKAAIGKVLAVCKASVE